MSLSKQGLVFTIVFLFSAMTWCVAAQDLSGTWIAKTPVLTVTMVFKVDGATLTGTVKTHATDETEIKDGKVKGDNISFYIVRTQNNKKIKVRFKGILDGDEIKFTRDADGAITNIIAKRAHPNSSITI